MLRYMHGRGHSRPSLPRHENFIAFTLKFPANAYHNPFNKEQKSGDALSYVDIKGH